MRVTDVKCGYDHTVALTDNNRVFCWGDNKYKQCDDEILDSFNDGPFVPKPNKLYQSGKSDQIMSICAGSENTSILIQVC